MILQPKRWQTADDPKYDPIRHKLWFRRLLKRKSVIPSMEGCLRQWRESIMLEHSILTQEQLCDIWNVNPREFRDFHNFKIGWDNTISPAFQSILDGSYTLYCDTNAINPIQKYIESVAPHYGLKGRPVWEMWEINSKFYPTHYAYPTN